VVGRVGNGGTEQGGVYKVYLFSIWLLFFVVERKGGLISRLSLASNKNFIYDGASQDDMEAVATVLGLSGAEVRRATKGTRVVYIKRGDADAITREYRLLARLRDQGFPVPRARRKGEYLLTEAVPGVHLEEFLTAEVERMRQEESYTTIFNTLVKEYLNPILELYGRAGEHVPEILGEEVETVPSLVGYASERYPTTVRTDLASALAPLEPIYAKALKEEGAWALDPYARNIRVDTKKLREGAAFINAVGFYDPAPRFEPHTMTRERLIGSLVAVKKWWNGTGPVETQQPRQDLLGTGTPVTYLGFDYLSDGGGSDRVLAMRLARTLRLVERFGWEAHRLAHLERVPATLGTVVDTLLLARQMSKTIAQKLEDQGLLAEGSAEIVRAATNAVWTQTYADGKVGTAYSKLHDLSVPKEDGFVRQAA